MNPGVSYPALWVRALASFPRQTLRAVPRALHDYPAWRAALRPGRSPMADEAPWITFAARRFLDGIVGPRSAVFEFGTGGSTLYFARRAASLISVEHDPAWAETVRAAISAARLDRSWRLLLVAPEAGSGGDPADPAAHHSSDGRSFRAYASAIDACADESLDVVSVDGRARPSCVAHARTKIKPGGYLLLDDSERPHYRRAMELLRGWERRDCFGPAPYLRMFWQTTFFQRPAR